MATYTENLNLILPALIDKALLTIINQNMQTLDAAIGDLADLQTTAKTNLVAAINEAALTGSGESLSPTLSLIEKIIIGYSVTTDTAFQAETAYYKNTGTAILPVYTALVAGTDYTVGDSIAAFGQTVYIYSDAGVLSVTRTTKPDGSPYNFIWCGARLFCPGAAVSGSLNIYGYYGSTRLTATYSSGLINTAGPRYGFFEIFQNMGYWDSSSSAAVSGASYVVNTYYSSAWNLKYQNSIAQYPVMDKILIGMNSAGVMPSEFEIYIYGVEKT